MADIAYLSGAPGSTMVVQSRTSWGLEVGRHRLMVTRTRDTRTFGRPDSTASRFRAVPKAAWSLVIGTFASVSAFGLLVFGAVASEPSSPLQLSRYSVSVPVPIRRTNLPRRASVHRANRVQTASSSAAALPISILSGPRFDPADEPHVVQAMRTGELQEWLGEDGQRRFLSAGPEQVEDGKRCRDLALLVRRTDGSDKARSAKRCANDGSHGVAQGSVIQEESMPHAAPIAETVDSQVSGAEPTSRTIRLLPDTRIGTNYRSASTD